MRTGTSPTQPSSYGRIHKTTRPGVYSLIQLLLVGTLHLGITYARPIVSRLEDEDEPKSTNDPGLYIYLGTAIALVLLGGAFAGLTIACVKGQVYLFV